MTERRDWTLEAVQQMGKQLNRIEALQLEQADKDDKLAAGAILLEYLDDVRRTLPDVKRPALLDMGALGMVCEAGEAGDVLKKHIWQGHPLDGKALALELGDVLWYITVLGLAIGYSLQRIMELNMEKRRKRYPEGFDPERSVHRDD